MIEKQLTEKELEAMTMRYVHRASLLQICQWLDVSRACLQKRLRSARRKLELKFGQKIPVVPTIPLTREVCASEMDASCEAEFMLFDSL